jgi:hypothetical protein
VLGFTPTLGQSRVATTNNEIHNVEIIHLFSFTLKDIMSDWCNNHMGDYPNCVFAEL